MRVCSLDFCRFFILFENLRSLFNNLNSKRWKFNGREFQCGGGTHFVSLDQLEITEEDAQFF